MDNIEIGPARMPGQAAAAAQAAPSQYVTFTCANRAYGVDIMAVREIRTGAQATELPGQPHGAVGVLDIRGNVVQVFDLSSLLGLPHGSTGEHQSQVVLVVSLADRDIGLMVDSVSDIIFAEPQDYRVAPPGGHGSSVVAGLIKNDQRLIAVLDLVEMFPNDKHVWIVD